VAGRSRISSRAVSFGCLRSSDMPSSLPQRAPMAKVNSVHRESAGDAEAVNKVHRLDDVPLEMAKARIGAAVGAAIGSDPLKAYGHPGLLSEVCSGEKVPDYLGRIYNNRQARRRFALSLLEDDPRVVVETIVRWTDEKVG
jgi:hypothetical protein